jgi:hypothetical protein
MELTSTMPNSSPTTIPNNILSQLFLGVLESREVPVELQTLEAELALASTKRNSAVHWLNQHLAKAKLNHPKYSKNQGGFILDILCAAPGTWISIKKGATSQTRCKQITKWFIEIIHPEPTAGISIQIVEEPGRFCIQVTPAKKSSTGSFAGTLVASVSVSKPEFQEAAIKLLSLVGFDPFNKEAPGFAFCREFSSIGELNQIVGDLLSNSDDFGADCELILSLNVDFAPLSKTNFACIDACRMAATKFIDAYHDAFSNKAGYPILLVSAQIRNLISHHFSLEPVGELWAAESGISTTLARRATDSTIAAILSKSAALRSVVYRVWANVFQDTSNSNLASNLNHFVRQLNEQFGQRTFALVPCHNSRETEMLARRLVQHFRDQSRSNMVVLHWRCNSFRQQDLLRPFDESISDLAGLHRRSEFTRNGQKKEIPLKINEIIESFAENYVDQNQLEVTSERIRAILVGSETPEVYHNVIDSFHKLISNLLVERETTIVIENFNDADELTIELANGLRNLPSFGSKLKIYAIENCDTSPPLHQAHELSEDVKELLMIAAAFGSEFRLRWLEEIWLQPKKSLSDSTQKRTELNDQFNSLIDRCLSAGILQFADGLIGGTNRDTILIQMSWAHVDTYEYYRVQISPEFRRDVANHFWKWLQSEAGKPDVPTDSVRLKRYVFQILHELHAPHWPDYNLRNFMFQIGSQLTQRAIAAHAHNEAHKRLEQTLAWYDPESPLDSLESKKILALVRDYLAMLEHWGEANEGQLSFLLPITDIAIRFSKSLDEIPPIDLFSLARTVWSYVFRRGNLASALQLADIANDAAHRSRQRPLQLEAYHILAVTLFAMGDITRCQEVALKGYDYCQENALPFQRVPNHGTHDGRVCCKVFLALSKLMNGEADASVYLSAALELAHSQDDANSKIVAISYGTLFHLLNNDLHEALALAKPQSPPTASPRWEAFRSLTSIAAMACNEHVNAINELTLAFNQFRETRAKWNFTELRAFWELIEATLLRRMGEVEKSQMELQSAIDRASLNGDELFLPLLQHLHHLDRSFAPARFAGLHNLISKFYV